MAVTDGVGFMVIVNVLDVPAHELNAVKDGVTTIEAVIGKLLVLVAVKAVISPVPLAGSPIAVLLLVQLKLVPGTVLLNVIPGVLTLLQ